MLHVYNAFARMVRATRYNISSGWLHHTDCCIMCMNSCRRRASRCGFMIAVSRKQTQQHETSCAEPKLQRIHATIMVAVCFQFSVNTSGSVRTGNMYLSRITSMLLPRVLLAKYRQKRVAHDRTRLLLSCIPLREPKPN